MIKDWSCHNKDGDYCRCGKFFLVEKEKKFRFHLIKLERSVGHPNGDVELAVAKMNLELKGKLKM